MRWWRGRGGVSLEGEARRLNGKSRRGLEQGEKEQAASEERCLGMRTKEGRERVVLRHYKLEVMGRLQSSRDVDKLKADSGTLAKTRKLRGIVASYNKPVQGDTRTLSCSLLYVPFAAFRLMPRMRSPKMYNRGAYVTSQSNEGQRETSGRRNGGKGKTHSRTSHNDGYDSEDCAAPAVADAVKHCGERKSKRKRGRWGERAGIEKVSE